MVLNKKIISKYCCGKDVQEIGPGPFQTTSQNLHRQPTTYYKELKVEMPGTNLEQETPEYEVGVPNICHPFRLTKHKMHYMMTDITMYAYLNSIYESLIK
jgi:hypothetical protein